MTPEQHQFLSAAIAYCDQVGGSVTSWIRTHNRNEAVGGVANSAHLHGLAVDVYPEKGLTADERHTIATLLGITLIVESDHDHLQPLQWPRGHT